MRCKSSLVPLKILTITSCIVLFLISVLLVAYAASFMSTSKKLGFTVDATATVAMSFAIVTMLVSPLAIVATCINSRGMFIWYAIAMVLSTIVMIVYGVYVRLENKNEESRFAEVLDSLVRNSSFDLLEVLQKDFYCCGIERYTDYLMVFHTWGVNYTFRRGTTMKPIFPRAPTLFKKASWSQNDPPLPKSPRGTLAPLLDDKNDDDSRKLSNAFMATIWKDIQTPLHFACVHLLQEWCPQYERQLPSALRNWFATIFQFAQIWRSERDRKHTSLKWWWNSGWDQMFIDQISPTGRLILPYTCCKNPYIPCYGHSSDTWQEGCRNKVISYWMTTYALFADVFLCHLVTLIINLTVVHRLFRILAYE